MKSSNRNIGSNTSIMISLLLHIILILLFWFLSLSNTVLLGGGQLGDGKSISAVIIDTEQVSSEYKRAKAQNKLKQTINQSENSIQKELEQQKKLAEEQEQIKQQQLKKEQEKLLQQKVEEQKKIEQQKLKQQAIEQEIELKKTQQAAELMAKQEAEKKAKLEDEQKQKVEKKAKLEAEQKQESEKKAKLEAKQKQESEKKAKLEAEQKQESEKKAKLEAEQKQESEKKAKLEAEQKQKQEAEKKAKLEAEQKAKVMQDAENNANNLDMLGSDGYSSDNNGGNNQGVGGGLGKKGIPGNGIYDEFITKVTKRIITITGPSPIVGSCEMNLTLDNTGKIINSKFKSGVKAICDKHATSFIEYNKAPIKIPTGQYNKYKNLTLEFTP